MVGEGEREGESKGREVDEGNEHGQREGGSERRRD